jgi:hypothetical protein
MLTTLKGFTRILFGATSAKLPVVCIFGHKPIALTTPISDDYEEKRLDCRCYSTDADLEQVLIRDRPDVIITCGDRSAFPRLAKAPFEIQKRWLHYDALPATSQLGIQAFDRYLATLLSAPGTASCVPCSHCGIRPTPTGNGSWWTTLTMAGGRLPY